jgi:hypothetical protein
MVIASIALLVALGGTSVAAVSVIAPRRSVNNAALQTGAVDSRAVKNHSLKSADFSTLPRGPAGPPGPTGAAGAAGAAGAPGPSDAYVKNVTTNLNVATSGSGVGGLTIPAAGNYVIVAKVGVSSTGGTSGDVRCTLTAGGNSDTGTVTLQPDGRGVITTMLGQQYTAAGSAGLSCNQSVGENQVNAGQIRIIAIKTGTLTQS